MKNFYYRLACLICLGSHSLFGGEAVFQLGWFTSHQGKSQHIDIEGLIGDDFSVSQSSDQNLLVGLGYYFDTCDLEPASLLYGINAFYLAPVQVKGNVTQEDLFTNLSYRYSITNYPIHFAVKALIPFTSCQDLVLDLAIGPNIMHVGNFKEHSLDDGITVPDHIFSAKTNVTFSASLGLGWRINQLWENFNLEIDYRFFYSGEGKLRKNNDQVIHSLHTGSSYANALFVSISL